MMLAASSTKNSISFVWIFELIESRLKSRCCTIVNTIATMPMVVVGLYILFISKNWFPIVFTAFLLDCLNFVLLIVYMPESPKWLLITG